ncbi:SkfA peptide export ATP-binding protein SkfE [Streptomyces chartreusis NRRL 3882]|uniref:SkfA peptide export ATP-binding protein SkfE n=1 Tax=Streptomyces chartreusis NRRL 3882 TaxID=1079985 RepID=A0A2N9BAK3_STRCX|nr:SkfA peptide export ATP-binding protein SkfE [Streptomyces chartreusis NRRL 3882]
MIDVRDLRMRYRSQDVLKGVEFTARRGEVVVLLGPNGAGKTTTIEVLEGFRMRSAGDVSVAGLLLAPSVLRRMARRESGAAMAERHRKAMQRVG